MTEEINTSDICRFCLSISSQKMHSFTEETLHAFNAYFSLKIHATAPLPNQICDDCNNKTKLLFEFRKSVLKNEKILYETLKKGHNELKRYILNIHSLDIKEEDEKGYTGGTLHDNDNGSMNSDEDTSKEPYADDTADKNSNNDSVKNVSQETFVSKLTDPIKDSQQIVHNSNSLCMLKFQCLTCFESFQSQNCLLLHYKTEHYEKPKENELNITFSEEAGHGGVLYKCSACSKTYDTRKSVNRHIASAHSDARPFLCKMCGRTYKTASEIVRHGRAHNGTKLYCSHQCGYSTVYHGALKEHERRHNASEFKYKCEKCNKGFHVKTWYLQHQNIHTGLKPFVCDICGDAFHMDKYLTTHRSLRHPQSSNLKRYVCVHCSLPCDSRNALTEHLKEEHGVRNEKKFLCDLCGKILSNAEQLKYHKRMHLGDKPYTCSTCKKSFAKKFNFQLHERSHSGVKAHECPCGRRYSQRSTLHRHIARHHTDDKLKRSKCKTFPAPELVASQKICT